ncbi:MAG: AarF/ABC1/UbiB kinase family protein [Bacteroidetes bacterium]|nr:AarF/ABC1/UbiB kinase family protein [Bacteroidota bacterium]
MAGRGKRYRQVFAVLIRHGFGDVVARMSGSRFSFLFGKSRKSSIEINSVRWKSLRMALEELGPTYIKLGQILSNRPGLLPDALTAELASLQDAVPPFSYEEAAAIVKKETGSTPEEIYASFDKKPIASASIAQVHKAKLKTGETVAVKIRRPGIDKIIRADIEVLRDIAALMERNSELASLRPRELVNAFEHSILAELDFKQEKRNLTEFYKKFEGNNQVVIPEPFPEYCSESVLTLRFLDGTKISKIEELKSAGHDLKKVARLGFDTYFTQIFEWGFFHADPHPGNLIITPSGAIGIFDFGMVGRIREKDRAALIQFIIGLGRDDPGKIVDNIEKLQGAEVEDKKALERDMELFIEEFGQQAVKDIDLNAAISKGRELINKHKLQLNPDLFLLLRTISLLEGIGITLDPEFRSLEVIKPYALQLLRKQLSINNLLKSKTLISFAGDILDLIKSFPGDSRKALHHLAENNLKIQVENKSDQKFRNEIRRSSIIIALSLLSAVFFTGFLVFSNRNLPTFFGSMNMPETFTLVGFILCLILIIRNSYKKI